MPTSPSGPLLPQTLTKHHPWEDGNQPATNTPRPLCNLLLHGQPRSHGGWAAAPAVTLAHDLAHLQLPFQEARAEAGRGLPLLLPKLWASSLLSCENKLSLVLIPG